jgi:hypothetical protein
MLAESAHAASRLAEMRGEAARGGARMNEKLCMDNSFLFAQALDHEHLRSENSNS